MGINVQVCWEKFANYWDVEMRLVPMDGDRFHLSAEEAVKLCDENTIGVVAILGSTARMSRSKRSVTRSMLSRARRASTFPVHVDGASGAFVAPFVDPDLAWDFRLPRVASRKVQGYAREVATRLSAKIGELGPFELITKGDELPVFAFKLRDKVENYTVFDVSNALRERGWQVPAYTFPKNREIWRHFGSSSGAASPTTSPICS